MSISNLFPFLITMHLPAYILLRPDSQRRTAWERINCALFKLTCMTATSVGRNFANTWIACVLSLICQENRTNMIVLFVMLTSGGWETRPCLLAHSFWSTDSVCLLLLFVCLCLSCSCYLLVPRSVRQFRVSCVEYIGLICKAGVTQLPGVRGAPILLETKL